MSQRLTRRNLLFSFGGGLAVSSAGGAQSSELVPSAEQGAGNGSVSPWLPGQATALCIGVADYEGRAHLNTPSADAKAIADRLSRLGFNVHKLINPTFQETLHGLASFRLQSRGAQLTLIYVAGHGVQLADTLHFLARDAFKAGDIQPDKLVPETSFLQATADQPRQRVLILDCCRTAPGVLRHRCFGNTVHAPSGQAGICVTYAAQRGGAAYDGTGPHSPFAKAFLHSLEAPELELERVARRVRLDVIKKTQGLQVPWMRSSLLLPISFAGHLPQA